MRRHQHDSDQNHHTVRSSAILAVYSGLHKANGHFERLIVSSVQTLTIGYRTRMTLRPRPGGSRSDVRYCERIRCGKHQEVKRL